MSEDSNGLHLNRSKHLVLCSQLSDSSADSPTPAMDRRVDHSSTDDHTISQLCQTSHPLHRYRSRTCFGRQLSNSEICRRRRDSLSALTGGHNLSNSGSFVNVVSGLSGVTKRCHTVDGVSPVLIYPYI